MQISSHLPAIIKLVSENATVSVVASTGSGKSVGLPAAIAATGARCFITVPTRTAAISLSEYQKVIQKDLKNISVGYAAEGNINYTKDTKIVYVTGGHMRKKLLSYFTNGKARAIDFTDVLVVDEVHTGSLDNSIIISLWMIARKMKVQIPRLVIASATPVPLSIQPPPKEYNVVIPAYPISIKYLNADLEEDKVLIAAADKASDIHDKFPLAEGHILVFAPGSNEVETIASLLKVANTAEIITAFSALSTEDINKIYKKSDKRKIIVATNIAEMSITISDIGFVVDTMLEKRVETSLSGGMRLSTRFISKDSAKQRAGRTGRTKPGICYRMCSEAFYERLEEHRPAEIERVPIYESVMEMLAVGLNPEEVLKELDPEKIRKTIELLSKLGMINLGVVTELGHFAPKLQFSVRNACFLYKWIKDDKYPIFPGIVICAIIDCYGPNYFWFPRKLDRDALSEYKGKFKKYAGGNDLELYLNMWRELTNENNGIKINNSLGSWIRDNSMNGKKIKELLQVVNSTVGTLKGLKYNFELGPFNSTNACNAARGYLKEVYDDQILTKRFDSYVNKTGVYKTDNKSIVKVTAEKIIALITIEIKIPQKLLKVVSFSLDLDEKVYINNIIEPKKETVLEAVDESLELLASIDLSGI